MRWDLTERGFYHYFCLRVPEKITVGYRFCFRFKSLINEYFKTMRVLGIVSLKLVLLFVH